jgi:hypothetical protein
MKPTCATRLINASKIETLALDNVQGHDDDVMGLLGPTSRWKSKISLVLGLSGCLQGDVLLSSWCKSLMSSCPSLGYNIHMWALSPMKVRANHSLTCTCPPGKVLQQQVRPLGVHKSQES